MNRTGAEIRASENQAKFIQDRISEVEKHFGELCTNFGSYCRKVSHMRDKGDELSKSLMNYAENESLNHTTKGGLKEFAENLSAVQDYREIQMKRMEAKVIDPLMLYGTSCKNAKERLKAAFAARDREIKQKKSLDKVREKDPSNRHQISQAETELQKASVDASYSSKALEEEIDRFEKTKLVDIKRILVDFVKVELMFHAKALEMYTNCYQSLLTMSEEEDLQEFRTSLHPPSIQSRLDRQQAASHSSLNTTGQSAATSNVDTMTPRGQRFCPNNSDTLNTNGSSYYTDQQDEIDDDEDDEDDDDDEDEDEDESDDNDEYARRMNGRK